MAFRVRHVTALVAVGIAAAILVVPTTPAAAIASPIGLAATAGSISHEPARGLYALDAGLTVLSNAPSARYFWATQFWFKNGDGGYFGLQSNGLVRGATVPKSAIFSIWGATGAYGPACQTFGGEGTGYSCRIEYPWVEGREYTMRLHEICCAELPANDEVWGAWVRDTSTGIETFIGAITVPGHWGWLQRWYNRFTEYFGPVADCPYLPYTSVRWRPPVGDRAYGSTNTPSNGYGPCLDYARGWDVGGQSYHEAGLASSPTDTVGLTVAYYYRSALTREPDPSGYAHYVSIVDRGTGQACVDSLRHVAWSILTSPEFKSRWNGAPLDVWIDRLYLAALHRVPDPTGRQAYRDYIGQHGWDSAVATMLNGPEWGRRGWGTCAHRY